MAMVVKLKITVSALTYINCLYHFWTPIYDNLKITKCLIRLQRSIRSQCHRYACYGVAFYGYVNCHNRFSLLFEDTWLCIVMWHSIKFYNRIINWLYNLKVIYIDILRANDIIKLVLLFRLAVLLNRIERCVLK